MGVLKTPSALLFNFSRYIGCKVNVNNRTGHSCHSLWVDLLCSLYLRTPHWQDCKLYFNLNSPSLRAGCAQQMIAFSFFLLNPHFWQVNQDYVSISLLFNPDYYQSHCVISHRLTQQMAIFQPITPHLLSPLSLPSRKHYYVLPLSHTSVLSLLICHSVSSSFSSLPFQPCLWC